MKILIFTEILDVATLPEITIGQCLIILMKTWFFSQVFEGSKSDTPKNNQDSPFLEVLNI